MTAEAFNAALEALRWSQRGVADALGCDVKIVHRYAHGIADIPDSIALWLATLAEFHVKNPPPADWKRR